jgi:medium-chain acyl-[acyl-carrier-protein] hydrolase
VAHRRRFLTFPQLVKLLLRVVRADFTLIETWPYTHQAPLDCAIAAYAGTCDPEASLAEVAAWQAQTTGPFTLRVVGGDHFFPWKARTAVLGSLADHLTQLSRGR